MKILILLIIILFNSLGFPNDNPLNQTLGRDNDPKKTQDITRLELFTKKTLDFFLELS